MLTVLVPATSTDLTSIENVWADLGLEPYSERDRLIVRCIRQASAAIADHCRRPFGMETVRESFICNQIAGDGPLLSRGPVAEILAVRDGNGALIPATGYALDHATGRLMSLDAAGFPAPWSFSWGSGLSIDYRAGYLLPGYDGDGNLPDAVERACHLLVASYLSAVRRDPAVKSETIDSIGSTEYWVMGSNNKLVSPEAEQLLVPYVRFYP